MAGTFTGVEIRNVDGLRCQGSGTTHAFFSMALGDLLACEETDALTGEASATFAVARDDERAAQIIRGRVAAFRTTDVADFREYRIADIQDGGTGEEAIIQVTCNPIAADLVAAVCVDETDPLNVVHDYSQVDATIDTILDGPVRDGLDFVGKTYIVTGTVEPTIIFDQSGDYETTAQMIASATSPDKGGGEFRLERNGTANYLMNVLDEVGSTAPVLYLRTADNLLTLRRKRMLADSGTWCIPKGIDDGTCRGADFAFFRVAASDGLSPGQVTLEDPRTGYPNVIRFTAQYSGFYLAKIGVAFSSQVITTSVVSNQKVGVANAGLLTAGDYVEIRRTSGATGARLSYLYYPTASATYGKVIRTIDRGKISGAVNYVYNGDASIWSNAANPPDSWTETHTGTTSQELTITRFGGASYKVISSGATTGSIRSPAITVYDDSGYTWRFWAWIYNTGAGNVVVDLVRADTHGVLDTLTVGTVDEWVLVEFETAAVGGATGGVKLQVTPSSAVQTTYVDAFGCQPANWERTDVYGPTSALGKCANDLWHEANNYLEQAAEPASYDCNAIDLQQIDGSAFPQHAVETGQTCIINDTQLGLTTTVRVLGFTRYHLTKELTLRFGTPKVVASQLLAASKRAITSKPADVDTLTLQIAKRLDTVSRTPISEYDTGGLIAADNAGQLGRILRKATTNPR